MSRIILILGFIAHSLFLNAQSKIIYKTIKPSFRNNLKIAFSLNHSIRFKERIILKDNIDSSKLSYNINLQENDPELKFKYLNNLKEINDSEVLIKGRCRVKFADYKMVEIAKNDPDHYKFKKKFLLHHISYDSNIRFRLYADSSGKQYVKYSVLQESYILNKSLIKSCTVTNLNIWVNSKKEGDKKSGQHFAKMFGTILGTLFILEASAIAILGEFFAVE